MMLLVSSCAGVATEFAAYGYVGVGPDGEGEFIGSYPSRDECEDAAEAWTSSQVYGAPVHAECYPVDKN